MWNTGSWCILLKNIIYQSGKTTNINTNTNTTNNTNNNTNGLSLTTKKRVDIAIYPLKSNLLDLEVSLLGSNWLRNEYYDNQYNTDDCRLQDLSTLYPQSYPQPNTGQIYFLI